MCFDCITAGRSGVTVAERSRQALAKSFQDQLTSVEKERVSLKRSINELDEEAKAIKNDGLMSLALKRAQLRPIFSQRMQYENELKKKHALKMHILGKQSSTNGAVEAVKLAESARREQELMKRAGVQIQTLDKAAETLEKQTDVHSELSKSNREIQHIVQQTTNAIAADLAADMDRPDDENCELADRIATDIDLFLADDVPHVLTFRAPRSAAAASSAMMRLNAEDETQPLVRHRVSATPVLADLETS